MTPIGLEVTDDQGYALAELLQHLDVRFVRQHAQDELEAVEMSEALANLREALEFAGYFPR